MAHVKGYLPQVKVPAVQSASGKITRPANAGTWRALGFDSRRKAEQAARGAVQRALWASRRRENEALVAAGLRPRPDSAREAAKRARGAAQAAERERDERVERMRERPFIDRGPKKRGAMSPAELLQRDLDSWKDRYCVADAAERETMADEGVALFDRLVAVERGM